MRTITKRVLRLLAIGAIVAGVMVPVAAAAQQDPVYPTPTSAPEVRRPPTPDGAVTARPVPVSRDRLPVTGGQIAGLALIGLGVTGAGVAMVRVGRQRRAAA